MSNIHYVNTHNIWYENWPCTRSTRITQENPQKGDWYNLLQDDMKLVSFNMTEDEMSSLNSRQIKNIVKKCVKSAAFNELK